MKKFTVLDPILHNGKKFNIGTSIDLNDDDAAALLAANAIAVGEDNPTKPEAPAVPEGDEKIAQIKAAILSLDKDNAELFTKSGAAKTEAIAAITGWPVSAAERDLAVPPAAV